MIVMKFGGSSIKNATAIRNVCQIIKKEVNRKPLIVFSAFGGVTDRLIGAVQQAIHQHESKADEMLQSLHTHHLEIVSDLFPEPNTREKVTRMVEEEMERLKILLKAAITIRVRNGALSHAVMSVGELLSSKIITTYLGSLSLATRFIDSRDIIIVERKKDEFLPVVDLIQKKVESFIVPHSEVNDCLVCPGFIASTKDGEPATLGRDGSDYTASLLGAALNAGEIQIWSDVDGILSADPSIIHLQCGR